MMRNALDAGIITRGGGGDNPRNVMASPLSGVEKGETFDVLPYVQTVGDYLLSQLPSLHMPRKLKVGFSNTPANETHATFRDLGFIAREDGTFSVYCAGGLGPNPMLGVHIMDGADPAEVTLYVSAMIRLFTTFGNYESRAKARTRYLQKTLGEDGIRKHFMEFLEEARKEETPWPIPWEDEFLKEADGTISGKRIIEQKQPGLYTVIWHPIGGQPRPETLAALGELMQTIDGTELRLAPDETAYIINLTGAEAEKILEATRETAQTKFETSVSCIGASICQVGARDSQALLQACVKAVGEAQIPDGALPQIHISGCPSSCGTHQTGPMGFRGGVRMADGKAQPAFVFYLGGNEVQGKETMGRELGTMFESEIPSFLVKLGKEIAARGLDFESYRTQYPDGIEKAAAEYLA